MARPKNKTKSHKIRVNVTIDYKLYSNLTLMRDFYFLNWSDLVNNFLSQELKNLELKLEKENPLLYNKYLKKTKSEVKET